MTQRNWKLTVSKLSTKIILAIVAIMLVVSSVTAALLYHSFKDLIERQRYGQKYNFRISIVKN